MTDAIAHRGPDGDGHLAISAAGEDPPLVGWLGHRRLRIIDLTEAAHQPMVSRDGSAALVYNGEIYNFRELRSELVAAGHRFESTGDTEVVLRAYEQWGDGCAQRLDGMYALAIWDRERARLLLARDRTGKKPLFYSLEGGRLTFGSEIKALLQAPWITARPDLERVPEFLAFGYAPCPTTMYQGIRQLPPGTRLVFDRDGIHGPEEYWDALPASQDAVASKPFLKKTADLLDAAVQRRLVADVPLGALLSGGVDSSVVVALMSRHATEQVRTFSIGFPEEPSFDERSFARLVADHFRTRHTEFNVQVDAVQLLDRLLWHHDQPFGDSSAIPTFLVCQLAREHVTVALNGDGGDEVFGGYDRFRAAALSELLPARVSKLSARAARFMPGGDSHHGLGRRLRRFGEQSGKDLSDRYLSWALPFDPDLLPGVLKDPPTRPSLLRSTDEQLERSSHLHPLDRLLYLNFKTYLPDDLAVKMDRMSMASSLETRSPFLDTQLIEHLARLPARNKIGLRRVKPVLRASVRSLIPDQIWNRRKQGFGVPMDRWFRGELGTMFEDEVLPTDARTRDLLNPLGVQRLWAEHKSGARGHGYRLWSLLVLEHWLRNVSRPPSAGPLGGVPRG